MGKATRESETILERIGTIQRELELLKRDLLTRVQRRRQIVSLYGAVQGADITDKMIENAKKSLFRELQDL